ncbi:MAG: GTP-binding protein [Mariprofundales bacterium]|nr:GTP-binding protein [Mariprofundales bacterium]
MRVRIFSAPRLHEALALAAKQLGPEAVILDRKKSKDALGNEVWQVHAALDDSPAPEANASPRGRGYGHRPVTPPEVAAPAAVSELDHDILQSSMERLARLVSGLERHEAAQLRLALDDPHEQAAFDRLLDKGVAAGIAAELAGDFAAGKPVGKRQMHWSKSMDPAKGRVTLVLVGPSGGGKTTLAAKLATHYSLKGIRVALVSTDVDRIGGSDLFRNYADVLGAPFAALRGAEDMKHVKAKIASAQLVLVDTAGISLRPTTATRQAKQLWGGFANAHRVMVLPANLDEADGESLLAQAKGLGVTHLALSKLDESSHCGKVINWAIPSRLQLCYCSFGNEIPGQMGWLTPKSIAALLAK